MFLAIRGGNDSTQCETCFTFLKIKDFKSHNPDKCMTYDCVLPKHDKNFFCLIGCGYTHADRFFMLKHIAENHQTKFSELKKWGFNYLAINDQYLKLVQTRQDNTRK